MWRNTHQQQVLGGKQFFKLNRLTFINVMEETVTVAHCRWVLTAAHCVTGLPPGFTPMGVRVGELDLGNAPDCDSDGAWCCPAAQDFDIEQIIYHPDYNKPHQFQNDIALIKLSGEVGCPFTADHQTGRGKRLCGVCLPTLVG